MHMSIALFAGLVSVNKNLIPGKSFCFFKEDVAIET